ncbi:hypothetical protein [Psychromarinibacter sp. S121]|uniref:hypothetical protein n=1 Tax=Psychromarinibacter sp. S121 TaxID=3415127 RepID=UPI003C79D28D
MRKTHTEARIMYKGKENVLARVDHVALAALERRLGITVEEMAEVEDSQLVMTAPDLRAYISFSPRPFALNRFRGVTRPPEDEAKRREVLRRLATHESILSVVIVDRKGREPAAAGLKMRLTWEIVDYILSLAPADLVLCPGLDRLMTGEEAVGWLNDIGDRVPQFNLGGDSERQWRKEIFLHDPELSAQASAWLRHEDEENEEEEEIIGAALRAFLDDDPAPGRHHLCDTPAGRSALYVMSLTIGLFALPLGAAALSYNALSGGSVRMTAYAMAATGLGSALETAQVSQTLATFTGFF